MLSAAESSIALRSITHTALGASLWRTATREPVVTTPSCSSRMEKTLSSSLAGAEVDAASANTAQSRNPSIIGMIGFPAGMTTLLPQKNPREPLAGDEEHAPIE